MDLMSEFLGGEMELQVFKNSIETYSGIIMFYSSECKLCQKQKELFDKVLRKYDSVNCVDDINYFIDVHNLDLLPETRIYEEGKVVWTAVDFVSETDLNFLKEY